MALIFRIIALNLRNRALYLSYKALESIRLCCEVFATEPSSQQSLFCCEDFATEPYTFEYQESPMCGTWLTLTCVIAHLYGCRNVWHDYLHSERDKYTLQRETYILKKWHIHSSKGPTRTQSSGNTLTETYILSEEPYWHSERDLYTLQKETYILKKRPIIACILSKETYTHSIL